MRASVKKFDKNSNALCAEPKKPQEQKKKYILRQYQDTEAQEEIKDYEDSCHAQLTDNERANNVEKPTRWG
jgi:hypothetical protein